MSKEDELTEFIQRRARALLAYGYVLTGQRATAEDLVQEALVRTYEHWDRLQEGTTPDAYVRRTMYHLHVSTWRKLLRREHDLDTAPLRFLVSQDTSDDVAERSSMLGQIAQLPVRERAVIALFYYEDMPVEQIATILDCAPSTVRSLLTRARGHLRESLVVSQGEAR